MSTHKPSQNMYIIWIYCNLCWISFLLIHENPSHCPEQDHSPARGQPTLEFLTHLISVIYEPYIAHRMPVWAEKRCTGKGIPPAASWPHPTSRHIQSTDVIQPGPVQMSPVKILVPSIAATPKQLPSPKPLWLGWDMIDLCTRKSPKIQDDTSQYKCSASVPVPTGSHWIRKRAWNFQD